MGLYILTCLLFMLIIEMPDDIHKLIDKLLNNCIIPSESEKIQLNNIANKIKDRITNFVSNNLDLYSFVTDIVFGGSFAKGTWLKNEADIDIFVKFNDQNRS